jgi:flavin-dependent dehydrogenase
VRASADGALLVGDSALFIDPFTGQGIYLALRSAEMAFEVGAAALAAGDTGAVRLAAYDRLRGAEFAAKVTLSRLLQAIIYSPRAARDVAAALRRDPRGARRLIGLIGDYRPASDLLSPSFLLRLATAGLG